MADKPTIHELEAILAADPAHPVRVAADGQVFVGPSREELIDALRLAEAADDQKANCEECQPEDAPETCGACFPSADAARLARRAVLAAAGPASNPGAA